MPLLWVSLAFLAGLCLPFIAALPWTVWAGLSAALLGFSFFEKLLQKPARLMAFRRVSGVTVSLLLAVLLAGAARYQLQKPVFTASDLAFYNDSELTLTAQIVEYPDVRDNAVQLTLEASGLQQNDSIGTIPVEGKVLVRLAPGTDWKYGDVVQLEGKLATPAEDEDFSYRDYLEIDGIYSTMYYPYASLIEHQTGNPVLSAVFKLREYANQTMQQMISQPEAGLLSGILLGLEHDIPENLSQAFKDTGTTHIIAISGFNIAIISNCIFTVVSRLLPGLWATPVSILVIGFYAVMVGAGASVVRAAIMGSMALIGRQIGRQGVGVNSLAFTGAVMCAFNPFLIRSVSFQLSFMATLGLVLYADPLHDWIRSKLEKLFVEEKAGFLANLMSDNVLFTLAAQVTTLPLIFYHFGRLSLTSLLTNMLILPVQPLLMILGGAALITGMIWLPLGKLLGLVAAVLPDYTNRVVTWLASIQGGSITVGNSSAVYVGLFYVLLLSFTLHLGMGKYFQKLADWVKKIRPSAVLVTAMLICIMVWRMAAALPDGRLHVTVMNVPDGPAVLVESPEGKAVLIDGGSSASRLSSELGQRLSMVDRRLDVLLVTQVKAKRIAALPVSMQQFSPQVVLWNTDAAALKNGELLAETLAENDVDPAWLESGQTLDMGDGTTTLHVLRHDTTGTALLLEYDRYIMLIPGGVTAGTLAKLDVARADVILLSAEDLEDSSAEDWQQFMPVLVIWSGAENDVVPVGDERWVHVDDLAYVEVITDGQKLWANEGR